MKIRCCNVEGLNYYFDKQLHTSGRGRRKPTDGPSQLAVLAHLNIAATIFSPSPTYFCCTAPMRTLMNVAPDCFAMACGRRDGAVHSKGGRWKAAGDAYYVR